MAEKENLFVTEDDDMSDVLEHETQATLPSAAHDVDPIVKLIPILHGLLHGQQSLHLLQFPGRPQPLPEGVRVRTKPASKVVEVLSAMETSRFYDSARATHELGQNGPVTHVTQQGVLTPASGLYACTQKGGRLVVVPVDSTAQLRALFQYIDDADVARLEAVRQETQMSEPAKTYVHVLQTAQKAGAAQAAELSGVGLCLRHVKRFNEEDWRSLSWRGTDDSKTQSMRQALGSPAEEPVVCRSGLGEFFLA